MQAFFYKHMLVELVPDTRKGKPIIWININRKPITFVSSAETGKRIATRFIDTVLDDHFSTSYQAPERGRAHRHSYDN